MYLGIDVGGTKTLVAALTNEGIISESVKFPTPATYEEFLVAFTETFHSLKTQDFRAGAIAAPGLIDRRRQIVTHFGNLPWTNVHLVRDIERITSCPMRLENDAKLGGLSEAMLLKPSYKKVLYVTVSTGIGLGLTKDGVIDTTIADGGGRTILIEHKGKLQPWEDFASGRAIVQTYGKMASEIHDKATWKKISRNLAPGLLELIAVLEPEVIVIGGGAGHYLDRFHDLLVRELKQYETPMLQIPPILAAKRPDEAVLYGCYDYAKQQYS